VELVTLNFSDDLNQAAEFSSETLRLLAEYRIPAIPQNYCVWYSYVCARNIELRDALDALISSDEAFTGERNAELFERFFGHLEQGAAILDTGEQMSMAVKQIDGLVQEVTSNAESYGQTVSENVSTLEASGDVSAAVRLLVDETKRMVNRNQELRSRLENSSERIEALKQNLEAVQKEALTDGLTGVANRKRFDITLRNEAKNATENGEPLCLILGDIDHFKKFNDLHGHQTGDQVLKYVGTMLSQSTTAKDLPARYGGEEFAVILPATDIETAIGIAESIRRSVRSKRLRKKHTSEDLGNITLSLGVALYRPGELLGGFIKRADDGLYQAKHQGRDKVVSEEDLHIAAE
jgi:diguanylate cyclase